MRIAIYQDASLDLQIEELVAMAGRRAPSLGLASGKAPFEISAMRVSYPQSYEHLPPRLLNEASSFDLAMLLTQKPYDNNFFHQYDGNLAIISLFGWDYLTDLPMENGVLFFVAERALWHIGAGLDHDENTGCVSDFLWDKSGIDGVMRAAYICRSCRGSIPEDVRLRYREELEQIELLLDHLSQASRRMMNVVDYWIEINPSPTQFDTFLCHNSHDKPEVRDLAERLRSKGIKPWLDEEQLRPGFPWQDELQDQIEQVKSALICVGGSGCGPWQDMELKGFISVFVDRGGPVIPVILSTAKDVPELPIFLRGMTWVDFRVAEPNPVDRLMFGITGIRP